MPDTTADAPGMNRRQLLKLGLFGTAVLTTVGGIASLGGCSADTPRRVSSNCARMICPCCVG